MGGRMGGLGLNMRVAVDRAALIKALKTNRAKHVEQHQEAVEGYIAKATKQVSEMLVSLNAGKWKGISFTASPPENYEDAYTTAIEMFEMTEYKTIELSASEFRMLVQDQWEWKDRWLFENVGYSRSIAADYAATNNND